jgi:hypothetical protein
MNTHPDQPSRETNPPRLSISRIWYPGVNDAFQLPQNMRFEWSMPDPTFSWRKFRESVQSRNKDAGPDAKDKRPAYIGEFLSTCAVMHAFRVPPQIDSTTAPEGLLSCIPETANMEDEKMWKLKANSHIYKPLPTENSQRVIRLVELLPSQHKTADIKCILRLESLSRNPSYEALSYVWGDAAKLKHIDVCGHAFYVTNNLEIALHSLRLWNKSRVLWIDAICINQNDVVEKSSQVLQMGEIYSQAIEVLLWLGPETNSSAKAFYFLRSLILPSIRQSSERSRPNVESEDGQLIISSEFSDGLPSFALYDQKKQKSLQYTVQEDPESVQYLQALCELLHRPWWRRIWVLQEVVRSRSAKLVCGTQTFPWTEFYHGLGTVVNACPNGDANLVQNTKILEARDVKTAAGARIKLLRNVATAFVRPMIMQHFRERWLARSWISLPLLTFGTQRFKSTDPRDMIYAVLGLINDNRDLGDIMIPDYNISPGTLFTKVAKWLLCHRQDLSLFEELQNVNCLPIGRVKDLSLPSWVPDFRFDRSIPPVDGHFWAFEEDEEFYHGWFSLLWPPGSKDAKTLAEYCSLMLSSNREAWRRPFAAGLEKKSPLPFRFSSDDKILTVTGIGVDTVLSVLEECLHDVGACVDEWKQKVLPDGDSLALYARSGTMKEAFWRTILANIDIWDFKVLGSPSLIKDRIDGVSEMPPRSVDEEKNILKGMLTGTRVPLPAFRRRMFQTSSGLLGLGPAIVEPGDIVTVLYGSRMPIVLRPCRNSEWYQVIGQR